MRKYPYAHEIKKPRDYSGSDSEWSHHYTRLRDAYHKEKSTRSLLQLENRKLLEENVFLLSQINNEDNLEIPEDVEIPELAWLSMT